ncbi:hypothetical protein AM232_19360 [Bacillus sp. FJAT-21352]|nr:hypothetical protein AM232_19360 [Bacillus sp. FJAT-21352]
MKELARSFTLIVFENDNFIISTVADAEGNQITEVKINKLTNQLGIDGRNLSKEEQIELIPIIEMASANACKYKSLGTYYGSSAVPKIGVSVFAAYLSTITKAPYSSALAAASVVVGAVPNIYYSLNDAQCTSGKYLYNKRTVKFFKDKARKIQVGKTSVSYQKRAK